MSNADFETSNKNPILSKNPIASPTQLGINQNVKNARYLVDSNGDLWTLLVQLGDWGTGNVYDDTVTFPDQLGNPNAGVTEMIVVNRNYVLNGAKWDRLRGGDLKLKTVVATAAGNTAVWTPTAGKKFRLMGIHIQVGAGVTLAAAGIEVINLSDSATNIYRWELEINNAAINTGLEYLNESITLPANGYLSAAADNVLNVNLGTAAAAGNICVGAWGLEE